jgi:uncharacterized membrane protein YgaE (UPF0421/DUF939 family)
MRPTIAPIDAIARQPSFMRRAVFALAVILAAVLGIAIAAVVLFVGTGLTVLLGLHALRIVGLLT